MFRVVVNLVREVVRTLVKHDAFYGVQWNLSIKDDIGTQLVVLYREVSLIQR